ncbi:MAG: hypothetical protein HETSPECPRED_005754 [Heterodermia speciosa]|uniref:Major facilitator superfamily (MFS) profile domain-containing protein n=1 Tax=Heterodermia speciosa TaxID=116794 RepID=A0A8H3FQ11_9LECA|nr:MAG: hypothetical protein HETSPECPRED_005754 [Heterodermia speciosa]
MVDARSIAHGDVWRQKVAWRLQIAFPAALLLCMLLICPESPRWLIKKNEYAKAFEVFRTLRETPLQAARDLYYIYAQPVVRARSLARITAIEQQEHLCFDISNFRLNYRPIDRRTSLTKAVVDTACFPPETSSSP